MNLQLTNDGVIGRRPRIVNAETGEMLKGVTSARLELLSDNGYMPVLHLTVDDVAVNVALEDMGAVVVEKTPPFTPLLCTTERHLSAEQRRCLQQSIESFARDTLNKRVIIFEEGMKVYQHVNGRWIPVDPDHPHLVEPHALHAWEDDGGLVSADA